MTLLFDTHVLLWFLRDDPQLSAAAKSAIEDPSNRKLVSVASCWELAIKAGLGKLKLGEPAAVLLGQDHAAGQVILRRGAPIAHQRGDVAEDLLELRRWAAGRARLAGKQGCAEPGAQLLVIGGRDAK